MLYNVIDRSFVLMSSSWSVAKARRIIEQLSPSHIIVRRAMELDVYYLFSVEEVGHLLGRADDQAPAQSALALDPREPTPMVDAFDDEMSAPDRAVVLDEGRVIGFVDSTVPPPPITMSRGPDVLREIEAPQRMLVTDFPSQVV